MIESHCTGIDPEIRDEELIWPKNAIYSDTLWSVMPFMQDIIASDTTNDTSVHKDLVKQFNGKSRSKTDSSYRSNILHIIAVCCIGVMLDLTVSRSFQHL